MDWTGIIVAGLVGTAVITMLMYGGPMMGMVMGHLVFGLAVALVYGVFVWVSNRKQPRWSSGRAG